MYSGVPILFYCLPFVFQLLSRNALLKNLCPNDSFAGQRAVDRALCGYICKPVDLFGCQIDWLGSLLYVRPRRPALEVIMEEGGLGLLFRVGNETLDFLT